ncbi:hypothetical protein [Xanthobacter oligotrophicus]|uniref:hypothetical protein n=1 Tax=Xanthobacter oligotrophicus TaxID=2607286 RepID=UPI0011F20D51|nr:hypothetical protein [Xanthobacter oligotrophicus]MCG5235851.1 hypothetical protein [Xanthobacter oligotrophicus]
MGERARIPVPPEWRTFLRAYWLRNLEQPFDEDLWLTRALKWLTPAERRALAAFLDTVLARNLPRTELIRVWNNHCNEWKIGDSGRPHLFFIAIRDRALQVGGSGRNRHTPGM